MQSVYESLKAAKNLPTLPGVAIRIIELAGSEATSIDDVAEAIQGDPALTTKVLKCLSSPLMGLGFSGTTLSEAVARIGMRGTQMMALSFSLVSQKHRSACPSFSFDRFWSESLGRAVAARCLARKLRGWDPEEAFITGLLARIGQLVFATSLAGRYEAVLNGGAGDRGADLEVRERRLFEMDHLEAGSLLLRDWKLPEVVWKTAASLAPDEEKTCRPARIIEVADAIAQFLTTVARHNPDDVKALIDLAWDRFEIPEDEFRPLLDTIGQNWTDYGQLLSVPTSRVPDLEKIEEQAAEQRMLLGIASEIEVQHLRVENEQLERVARHDRLTGLLNRATFDEALPAALETAQQTGRPVTLLMIDADHFKAVNDTHGHRTGDGVLAHLARMIDDNLRKRDEVFRYGGEEFAVVAGDCPAETATQLAETIRAAVEAAPYEGESVTLDLTVSIGIACTDTEGVSADPAAMIEYADARLYDAKHAGRNCWRLRPPGKTRGAWWRRVGKLLGHRAIR